MQTKYDWIISSQRESSLVELMEEHCSLPDEMCNRVQNIFAIWNIGWKGLPAWVKQENNLNLHFVSLSLFFFALDVVELCMMVTVMQFFFHCVLHHTHLESLRDFNSLHSPSDSAKTKQKEKVWRTVSNVSPKTQSSKCKWWWRENSCRATGTRSFTFRGFFFLFVFNLPFISSIYYFV